MAWVMIANAIIEIGWIAATVYLVVTDHNWWAVVTFIGSVASGYVYKKRNDSNERKV